MDEQLGELKDIELPMQPGMDWFAFLQDMGLLFWLVLLLLVLFLLVRYSRWFDRSLLLAPIHLRWQLYKIKKQFNQQKTQNLDVQLSRQLYDWSLLLQSVFNRAKQHHPDDEQVEFEQEVDKIKSQAEYMAFSNTPVSRETFLELVQHASVVLNKMLSFKFICKCLFKGFTKWRGA